MPICHSVPSFWVSSGQVPAFTHRVLIWCWIPTSGQLWTGTSASRVLPWAGVKSVSQIKVFCALAYIAENRIGFFSIMLISAKCRFLWWIVGVILDPDECYNQSGLIPSLQFFFAGLGGGVGLWSQEKWYWRSAWEGEKVINCCLLKGLNF